LFPARFFWYASGCFYEVWRTCRLQGGRRLFLRCITLGGATLRDRCSAAAARGPAGSLGSTFAGGNRSVASPGRPNDFSAADPFTRVDRSAPAVSRCTNNAEGPPATSEHPESFWPRGQCLVDSRRYEARHARRSAPATPRSTSNLVTRRLRHIDRHRSGASLPGQRYSTSRPCSGIGVPRRGAAGGAPFSAGAPLKGGTIGRARSGGPAGGFIFCWTAPNISDRRAVSPQGRDAGLYATDLRRKGRALLGPDMGAPEWSRLNNGPRSPT